LPAAPSRRPDDGRVIFGYFGGSRKVKGFHLLPDAIATVLGMVPSAHFLIQCPYNEEFSEEISRLREMGGRVQMRERPLGSRDGYYATFGEMDVILNAYDPAKYGDATSMICIEAMGMGKGLITTIGNWAEEAAEEIGAANMVMRDFSSPALAEAIIGYAARRQEMANKAAAAQTRTREHHNVDAFLAATGLAPFSRPDG
jgi:hypothetical protein